MEHDAGAEVSLEQCSVCLVEATGRVAREAKVASEPQALIRFFGELGLVVTRVGLEAEPLSQWLHAGPTEAGLEVGIVGNGRFAARMEDVDQQLLDRQRVMGDLATAIRSDRRMLEPVERAGHPTRLRVGTRPCRRAARGPPAAPPVSGRR